MRPQSAIQVKRIYGSILLDPERRIIILKLFFEVFIAKRFSNPRVFHVGNKTHFEKFVILPNSQLRKTIARGRGKILVNRVFAIKVEV